MSHAIASALADRDANAQLASNCDSQATAGKENHIFGEQHKRVSGLDGNGNGSYISPSDAILSPASQKLAGLRQRQINKHKNPIVRSLFSRTAGTASSGSLEESEDANNKQ